MTADYPDASFNLYNPFLEADPPAPYDLYADENRYAAVAGRLPDVTPVVDEICAVIKAAEIPINRPVNALTDIHIEWQTDRAALGEAGLDRILDEFNSQLPDGG